VRLSACGRKQTFAGLDDRRRMIGRAPWPAPVDPMEGVVVHELSARTGG
jgi:hypothetical protein